jgi:hypothetical protein
MRSEGQIRHQLKQVAYRHLQKRLRENFRQRPANCAHNVELVLDTTTGAFVGLCGVLNPDGTRRDVPCDARIPGCSEMASKCGLFHPLQTKAEVKADFNAILRSGDRGVIASQFPDIAALLWVLDEVADGVPTPEEIDQHADLPEDKPTAPSGWWGGLLKKLGG